MNGTARFMQTISLNVMRLTSDDAVSKFLIHALGVS